MFDIHVQDEQFTTVEKNSLVSYADVLVMTDPEMYVKAEFLKPPRTVREKLFGKKKKKKDVVYENDD